jgi:hypothetical protein
MASHLSFVISALFVTLMAMNIRTAPVNDIKQSK